MTAPGRLLLLVPTTTYRADDFMAAAAKLRVEVDLAVTVASEEASTLEALRPEELLSLDFRNPNQAADRALAFAHAHPVAAVVGVDDRTALAAAVVAEALGLPHNAVDAVTRARSKYLTRKSFKKAGLRTPDFFRAKRDENSDELAIWLNFPCVVKPLGLAASQGVILARDAAEFPAVFRRVAAIVEAEAENLPPGDADYVLIEDFIPGAEVAVDGLLRDGDFTPLALFDKPDPLDGPFFEETIYVTPSQLPRETQAAIVAEVAKATRALGLTRGPVHAELRLNDRGPWVLEVAPRSIGGQCGRALKFGGGRALEELIIREAMGFAIPSTDLDGAAAGVMMIPIPAAGVLQEVTGLSEARAVPGIEGVSLTIRPGERVVPIPEGGRYLGFIFARADTPQRVETALRAAHRLLRFKMAPEY